MTRNARAKHSCCPLRVLWFARPFSRRGCGRTCRSYDLPRLQDAYWEGCARVPAIGGHPLDNARCEVVTWQNVRWI